MEVKDNTSDATTNDKQQVHESAAVRGTTSGGSDRFNEKQLKALKEYK